MAVRSTMLFTTAAKRADSNIVFAAMGRGPNSFPVPASQTGNDPATHYFAHDGSMTEELSIIVASLPDNGGTPPELAEGGWLDWFPGEANEAAAQAKAKAACAAMQVAVASNVTGASHRDGMLSGLSLQEIQVQI